MNIFDNASGKFRSILEQLLEASRVKKNSPVLCPDLQRPVCHFCSGRSHNLYLDVVLWNRDGSPVEIPSLFKGFLCSHNQFYELVIELHLLLKSQICVINVHNNSSLLCAYFRTRNSILALYQYIIHYNIFDIKLQALVHTYTY